MMMLIHGPMGSINWQYTSAFYRNNWGIFCEYLSNSAGQHWTNFGAGSELTFTCVKCNRTLPLAISEADHVIAKSTLSVRVVNTLTEIRITGTHYQFPSNGTTWAININTAEPKVAEFKVEQGMFYLKQANGDYFSTGTLLNAAQNNIENLQLLCAYCNRSKGNR
jgi:5-methylcytosine-specific restriction endonuclease McrA